MASIVSNVKIFKMLINTRSSSFFESNNNQFGFRKQKNMELVALSMVHKLLPSLENKSYAISAFLDLTACFDTVSRECLLPRLQMYGVRGVGLNLISSCYTNRKQYVSF